MIAIVRRGVLVVALGGLAGVIDGAVRGMTGAETLAAAGWCAIATASVAATALGVSAALRRVWASDTPAVASARARLGVAAIGVWAMAMVLLGDRFAVRFSAVDLAALLWAAIGVASAGLLALVLEPAARRVALRWPPKAREAAASGRSRVLVPVVLAIAIVAASVAAIVRGIPADPRSLGALAARGLGA